ncbi:Dynactin, 150 kDa isoform [Lecanosticta acicola]|uniref:Dynactin, 150 kDa isoform n=1 Tax=Lecanosticta acicola TaxID=111012 RepID=A0AAI8Z8I7_9PEZI|nr:Dynactin, 150 kDa isoform [Lecanosticta acicola]
MTSPTLSPGQKIELNDLRVGIVRYVGTTSFQTGEWIGVELEQASGKNDGSVQGKRYFECPSGHGIFCRASGVNRVLEEAKAKAKAATNGAPAKGRPSSVQRAPNGARRQTLQQDAARRGSAVPSTPTPATRPGSGVRSPVKSPTKQLATNGTSSASTSRTGTPPAAGKKPATDIAGKHSRSSVAPPSTTGAGRRTSTLPPATGPGAQRNSRQPASSTATARAPTSRLVSGSAAVARPAARPGIRQRLEAARKETATDETSERSSIVSPRESTESEAASTSELASHEGTEDGDADRDDTIRPNFAPPPVPPIPPEPAERPGRQRRPSSVGATSVHSQRTVRSTAAAGRQIEELEAKLRLMERKRNEDRELKQKLEKAEQERDQYKGIIEKLQNKYRPQQAEMDRIKKELADFEKRYNEAEESKARQELEFESAVLDREFAEEQAEQYKTELEILQDQSANDKMELELLREENSELSKEMSPEERTSAGWMQLEKSNERLREALISLRDIAHDKEAELKEQMSGLEKQVQESEPLQKQYEETREELLRSQANIDDLREQLELAGDAEIHLEQLGEEIERLRHRENDLKAAIEDLEALRELNDELEINHVEAEKQLQEEIDFKDSLLLDRERTAKEQQAALDEADYNINRFRELVTQLQSDLQDLQASKQISESEAAQLSGKSRAMMELNQKLQSSAAKTQVKTIDLELRKLDAQEASEHLSIVQLFLPDSFTAEKDSVLALLRFKRIGFKANLVQSFVKERIASFGTRGQDEDVFAACDAADKLTWVSGMADRLVYAISSCSIQAFEQYGGALYELEVVERTLNDFVDALRRDELKESEMTVRLGRSIEVMTHLSSLHIRDGLAEHSDDLIMRMSVLQSRLDSATSALTLARSMVEKHLSTTNDDEESEDEGISDTALILNRLNAIVEIARHGKVASGKTHRALLDLQARSLTLEESLTEQFESAENVAAEITAYACQSGAGLQELFGEEGRIEPPTPSEVASSLSQAAKTVFSLSESEAGPYATLNGRLRDLSTLLADLSNLPTDLDNTVEFERAPAPWIARADELKQTKITSVDIEAELARTLESVRERDDVIRQKEKELEEYSVKVETLEARMKDASKRSAKIAELERSLREAKESEGLAKRELAQAKQEAQHDVDRVREEMARFADEHKSTRTGNDLDGNAMGASVRITMKRQEHKIAGLESAVRYLNEVNNRLRLPAADAPLAVKAGLDWLHGPLNGSSRKPTHSSVHREGERALQRLVALATLPPSVDLSKMPENKLAWRPVKESSRWRVERRNEEWAEWKQWREDILRNVGMPRGGRGLGEHRINGAEGTAIAESAA